MLLFQGGFAATFIRRQRNHGERMDSVQTNGTELIIYVRLKLRINMDFYNDKVELELHLLH